jgi:ATP-dependent DNA helicase RecG
MTISVQIISKPQADKVRLIDEGQFSDLKAAELPPSKLTKPMSAFANADGGDLYIGISDKERQWQGFANVEAANGHIQTFEEFFPLGTDCQIEFLKCEALQGLVMHVQIGKTQGISKASDGIPYIRRGAQSLPVNTPDKLKRLELNKGITSFENETVPASKDLITTSEITIRFVETVVPNTEPEPWLKKQQLLREEKPTVAGVLLFAGEPQAILPKRCGIKVYRYKTRESQGFREALAFDPKTIEGCLYDQIKRAVQITTEIVESIPRMGEEALESIRYPPEALHEIITNAMLHRDYSIADDIHIRIFDNRIEVQSPGRLPAHITPKNILDERFARNGQIVRILNKFPDPPNKDVGEGLNTAFSAMHSLGLREPIIQERDNSVLVIIRHEPLASPEQAILEYLDTHETIKNKTARAITHVRADYQMKAVFGRMVEKGQIEQVPNTRTNSTAYRKIRKDETEAIY